MYLNANKSTLLLATQELLQKGSVKTQEEIKALLLKQGFDVNQTRISRLLQKLGAIKLKEGGQTVYRLMSEMTAVAPNNPLTQLILGIDSNEVMIVIRTSPGSADIVARLLDLQEQLGILGTIAGDDTIFIAPERIQDIQEVREKITKILFG